MPGLLLDVSCLCDEHTDDVLEGMYKAISSDLPGGSIWDDHPNPFVRQIVEMFTERGLARIAEVQAEFAHWVAGERYVEGMMRRPAPGGQLSRWSAGELALVRTYLSTLRPDQFQLDDWMLLVDYLYQRYMPAEALIAEATWLATRANVMGRVSAAMDEIADGVAEKLADDVLRYIPNAKPDLPPMSPAQMASISFGRAHCCEAVTSLADAARHRMRKLVVDWQEASFLGNKAGAAESLQSKLLDEFGTMNRDWRRIAITEATENVNQGFVAAAGVGARLRRVEKYNGACAFCRSIDGQVVEVVPANAPKKNGNTEIWVGKTNVGRSASPRKRVEGVLVEREDHERWWIASGAQHPHCRGSWVRAAKVADDPDFEAWLAKMKKTRKGAPE